MNGVAQRVPREGWKSRCDIFLVGRGFPQQAYMRCAVLFAALRSVAEFVVSETAVFGSNDKTAQRSQWSFHEE